MKHIFSLLAICSTLVFLSCGTEYAGNVGGVSDPDYCVAPDSVNDLSTAGHSLSNSEKAEYVTGCEIYVVKCATCHMLDGFANHPTLDVADSPDSAETLCPTCEVHSWLTDKINTSMPPERGESKFLTIDESSKVATYMRANFFSDMSPSNDEEPANLPESMRPDEDIVNQLGQSLYIPNCSGCHGTDGIGDFGEMNEYTIDRLTLIGKITGNGLGLSTYTRSPDNPMSYGEDSVGYSAEAIADYMEEAFDYITWSEE